jgi:hypothetical protein
VESLNVIAWYLGLMSKTALFNYMPAIRCPRSFGTKTHRPFVATVFLVMFIVLLLPFIDRSAVIDLLRSHRVFPGCAHNHRRPAARRHPYLLFRQKKVDAKLRAGIPQSAEKSKPAPGGP